MNNRKIEYYKNYLKDVKNNFNKELNDLKNKYKVELDGVQYDDGDVIFSFKTKDIINPFKFLAIYNMSTWMDPRRDNIYGAGKDFTGNFKIDGNDMTSVLKKRFEHTLKPLCKKISIFIIKDLLKNKKYREDLQQVRKEENIKKDQLRKANINNEVLNKGLKRNPSFSVNTDLKEDYEYFNY